MKILVCPDSFKGSLSSEEVCTAIAKGIELYNPKIKIMQIPSSDGGEGFCSSMRNIFGGEIISCEVSYPLGNKGIADYIYNSKNKTAYIEMASAAGLTLLSKEERDILRSNTFGVGQLIANAILLGAERVVVGLGGSATNDCGMGLLSALGVKFYDNNHRELEPIPLSLSKVEYIDKSGMLDLSHVTFVAACDVNNPLYGSEGAVSVFSRQKGATDADMAILEKGLKHFSVVMGIDGAIAGSGAAGGVGAAMISVLGAEYVSGASLLVSSGTFKKALNESSLIITGEGNTDGQTSCGKLISVIAKAAQEEKKTLIVLSGGLSDGSEKLLDMGVSELYSLSQLGYDTDYCIANASRLITERTVQILNEIKK